MHCRPGWFQGDLDDCGRDLLSASFNYFLASTRALGTQSVTVSSGQRRDARGVRDLALAGAAAFADQRCMAWGNDLGSASCPGGICRVDYRIEKHPIVFVVFVVDLVLPEVARKRSVSGRPTT